MSTDIVVKPSNPVRLQGRDTSCQGIDGRRQRTRIAASAPLRPVVQSVRSLHYTKSHMHRQLPSRRLRQISCEATWLPFPFFPSSKSCAGILHMRSTIIISIRHIGLLTGLSSTLSHHEQAEEVVECSPGLDVPPHVHWYAVILSKACYLFRPFH